MGIKVNEHNRLQFFIVAYLVDLLIYFGNLLIL